MKPNCSYCKSDLTFFEQCPGNINYYHCSTCNLYLQESRSHLSIKEERERYETHQNDRNNPQYLDYLNSSVVELKKYLKPTMTGLDFGCGPGPAMDLVLKDYNLEISSYDPIFFNESRLLEKTYDFICSIEVVEHFFNPYEAFLQLSKLMNTGGYLQIRTEFYDGEKPLKNWWYQRDPTHVCFYNHKFFERLALDLNWEIIDSSAQNRILFQKN